MSSWPDNKEHSKKMLNKKQESRASAQMEVKKGTNLAN